MKSQTRLHRCSANRGARGIVAVLSALLLLLLAACGSSGDAESTSESSPGKTDDAAVAAAKERLAPLLAPVEKIEVDTPLTKTPPAGQSLHYIRYNNPTAAEYDASWKEAVAALGWKLTIRTADGADPQAIPNGMIQAVSENADYIVINGVDLASMGSGLDEAKKAGIPVFLSGGVGEPQGEANGLYGNAGANATVGVLGLLDQMIVDSGGSGSALLVNAPDFPILAPTNDAAKKYVAEHCSGCSLELLGISASDLGGDVASTVVAAVRQNPDVKYVVTSFDALANGLPQALEATGLDDVKVYVSLPGPTAVPLIESGEYDAGTLFPQDTFPWLVLDQVARVSVGMDPPKSPLLSMQLWTPENMPKGETEWSQPNYQDQYKKLWQVS
jgi:ABC-type sugar transport system substrate-binding protein